MFDSSLHERVSQNLENVLSQELQNCIDSCLECHRMCEQLLPYCLDLGGRHASRAHIQLLANCADITRTAAHFMMWESEAHTKLCAVCADVCTDCSVSFEELGDNELMRNCAKICQECAFTCKQMVPQH
jgi:hypothetical protein